MSFVPLSILIQDFFEQWVDSRYKGDDAIQPYENLKERIDLKLFDSGKLDFEQMKKIMTRMHRIDDALMGLDRIVLYLEYYENLCKNKNLPKQAKLTSMFLTSSLKAVKVTTATEGKSLRNQIERCNLYYQPAIKTKTLRVAEIALIVSALSFLLSILNATKLL